MAITILFDEFSREADRVSRFQRDAEVLAWLNHPHIAVIYDLQEAPRSGPVSTSLVCMTLRLFNTSGGYTRRT